MKTGELEIIGGPAYLTEIMDATPSTANLNAYAKIISEKALVRAMININNELIDKVERANRFHKHTNIGIWEWDIVTGGLEWTDEIFNMFGYSKSETEISYENFISVVHHDDRKAVEKAIQA